MAESIDITVFYGSGTVRYNDFGVDLSEFKRGQMTVPNPEALDIRQLKHWLTTSFGLDPNQISVSVHSVWTKSTDNLLWELRPIERTQKWLSWIRSCIRRKIQPYAFVQPMAKEDTFVEESGGYEQGQSSHPVDFRHRGEQDESNYMSHNLDHEVVRQSGESSIIHDSDVANGDKGVGAYRG